MPRTTVDIDASVLRELKGIQRREHVSLGRLVSRLLAEALAGRHRSPRSADFRWIRRKMKPLVDLADKEAVYAALDGERE